MLRKYYVFTKHTLMLLRRRQQILHKKEEVNKKKKKNKSIDFKRKFSSFFLKWYMNLTTSHVPDYYYGI